MPNSYVNLIYHLIFSTRQRRAFIKEPFRGRLHDYLRGAFRGEGGRPIEVGGADDHVHILTHLRADRALSEVLQRVKSSTTGWVHSNFPELHSFAWQEGYAAFTVSQSHLEGVRSYIADQMEHHRKRCFQEELQQLFEKHGIKPDPRFWER
jgi:putative transposase